MSVNFAIHESASRAERYNLLIPQVEALLDPIAGPVANMANVSAAIHEVFGFHWVGFYLVSGNELHLGPFQGPTACTRIAFGKGVCGEAWSRKEAVIVPDVERFPGHIACSPHSKSEIVIPFSRNGEVIGVFDIDSDHPDDFSETDLNGLTAILSKLSHCL